MDLSLSNYLKVYPVLLKWLKDSGTAEGRDIIIRAIVDSYKENKNNSNNDNDASGGDVGDGDGDCDGDSDGDGDGADNHETTTLNDSKDNSSLVC
ncbi:unnamed protein product [Trichobilharzia regenti]|nr:unnamed protein product [Trichobilharzia regenti]